MNELTNLMPAIQLMMALIFWETTKYAIRLFLGKTVGSDNVTRAECEQCQKKIAKELQAIKGVLLEVAIKSGVSMGQLKALTK